MKLTSAAGKYACPRFSKDGRYLGFVKYGEDEPGVYVMPAFGGSVAKLVALHPWDDSFDWSPDGKSVVYTDSDNPNDRGVLHRMDLETMQDSTIPTGDLAAPDPLYSPDGRWIGFGGGLSQIAIVPSGGGKPRVLTDGGIDGVVGGFAWTADSKEIVYSSLRRGGGPLSGGDPSQGANLRTCFPELHQIAYSTLRFPREETGLSILIAVRMRRISSGWTCQLPRILIPDYRGN
jgi:Tol biopolymer transport system component